MSDDQDESVEARKRTHSAIEDAVREHIDSLGIPGVITGWTISISISAYEDGEEMDMMYSTQSDGLTKWALVGLLTMSLDGAKRDGYIDTDE